MTLFELTMPPSLMATNAAFAVILCTLAPRRVRTIRVPKIGKNFQQRQTI
jgi:hypothetical protein